MKLSIPVTCSVCHTKFFAHSLGAERVPSAPCLSCGTINSIFDRLSISVVGERLFYRAEQEITEGDYTVSIICSAIAVETFFAQAFLKWKRIKHLQTMHRVANEVTERDGKTSTVLLAVEAFCVLRM